MNTGIIKLYYVTNTSQQKVGCDNFAFY